MSFEGSFQILCYNGHQWCKDAYSRSSDDCPVCGAAPAVRHLKDETNCEPVELIFELAGSDERPCTHCGGSGKRPETVYIVPNDGAIVKTRQWNGQDGWHNFSSVQVHLEPKEQKTESGGYNFEI